MKASIIIPAYKPVSLLKTCVDSIIQNTTLTDIEVIIVCNGSDKESADFVVQLGNPFKLIWNTNPLGFSTAVNTGLKLAQSDYIVLLNTDVILLDFYGKDVWIDKLLNPLIDDPTNGITGLGLMWVENIQYAPFYCVGIKRKLFDEIGYLDEIFNPGYGEDTDFCYRAVHAGYNIVQVDNPVVDKDYPTRTITDFPIWHIGNQSFNDLSARTTLINRNMKILSEKYSKKT